MRRFASVDMAPFYLYLLGSMAFLFLAIRSLDPISGFGSVMFMGGSILTIALKLRKVG